MINSLTLKGFKSFVEERLVFNRLTLLTGLNSSGKSSVIQALLMLKKASDEESFSKNLPYGDTSNFLLKDHGTIKELINPYYTGDLTIEVTNEYNQSTKGWMKEDTFYFRQEMAFPFIVYIEAGRFGAQKSVDIYNDSTEMGSKGENIFKCIDKYADQTIPQELRHPLSEGDTFLFNLRAWLNVVSPNIKFEYKLQQLSDSSYSQFNEHRATNVGFGLSYTLPIITALLRASLMPGSLVLLENPEAHLHPKGQTEIARLIALCVQAGVQVIVETHSDHLFDGIRIFAKKNDGFAALTQMYWFELDKEKNTIASPIELDDNGRVTSQWPNGFFDQFEINAEELL